MSLHYFGTDGIRGPYGGPTLNDGTAFRAGRAAVRVAREQTGAAAPKIALGRDTRASGAALRQAFAQGAHLEGGSVVDLGVAPTPCVAFATRESDASLGCAITASHNPAGDNGIKFFESSGVKPSAALEQALDDALGSVDAKGLSSAEPVTLLSGEGLRERYVEAVLDFFPGRFLEGKRVALDCANGALSKIAPKVFRALGADLQVVANAPDGANINDGVGSEHPEALKRLYSKGTYDLGFAFDGDGDRVILFDETGQRVSGEAILAALAVDAKERGELVADTLVTTVQSNLGLDAAMRGKGIRVERTDVGDKHVARLMLREGYAVGGEESGHVVLGRFAVSGDGLVAALALSDLLDRSGASISSLASVYQAFPQVSKALNVAAKPPLDSCSGLKACIEKLEREFGEEGRLLVRYSGTESKIRLLVEARTQDLAIEAMQRLEASVREDLELV